MMKKFLVFFTIFISLISKLPAAQMLDGVYYDWSVFVLDELGEEKKCYMVSFPKKSIGNYKKEREPYILVTRFAEKKVDEVSVYSGFEYKIGSDIYLSIDGKQFTMFTKEDIAWAKTKEIDKEIIMTMLDSATLKIRTESAKTEYTVDEYSLKGFIRAYKKMKELCEK
jgi:hypothetical protein